MDRKTLPQVFLVVIIAAVIFIGYRYATSNAESTWPTYSSSQKSISFDHPATWTIEEGDDFISAKTPNRMPQPALFRIEIKKSFSGDIDSAVWQLWGSKEEALRYFRQQDLSYKLTKFEHHGCAAASLTVPFVVQHQLPAIVDGQVVFMLWHNATVINCKNRTIAVMSTVYSQQKESTLLWQEPLDHMLRSISLAGDGSSSSSSPTSVPASSGLALLAGSLAGPGHVNGTAAAAAFNSPSHAAVDSSGNIYVADSGNQIIRKITPDGVVTTVAGTAGVKGSSDGTGAAAKFNGPGGVAVDRSDNVYVAEIDNETIRKISPTGVVTTLAGSARASGSADGTGAAARFNWPTGVAVDRSGNVYVADMWNSTIRKITSAGVVTTLAGTAGIHGSADGTGAAAQFNGPIDVAVDIRGDIYVADSSNNTIRKITPTGVVTTLAGTFYATVYTNFKISNCQSTDGTGAAARFCSPSGVAVDGSGNVYVADSSNNTIRKITPAGIVTTVAGFPGHAGYQLGALPGLISSPTALALLPSGNLVFNSGNAMLTVSGF